jgi:hypothetical protein
MRGAVSYLSPSNVEAIRSACNNNLADFYEKHRDMISMCAKTFYNIMNGKPATEGHVNTLERMCDLFSIDLDKQSDVDCMVWVFEALDKQAAIFEAEGSGQEFLRIASKVTFDYTRMRDVLKRGFEAIKYRHTYLTEQDLHGPERPRLPPKSATIPRQSAPVVFADETF